MVKRISWKSATALLLLMGLVLLAGCGLGLVGGGASPNATSDTNSMPLTAKLAFGTFKLAGTQEGITAEQAAKLLPLWKAARYLATSDAAAPGEVAAIYKQIEGEMSPEQMKIINGLAREDLGGIAQQMGLHGAPIQENRTGGSGQAAAPSNQARLPEGGGGFFIMGGPPRPQSSGTSQPNGAKTRSTTAIPAAVYDAVIKLLQSKIT
jgi:hypothetical protein